MRNFLLFLCLSLASEAETANWPQFRGPQASGIDTNAPAPIHWDVEKGQNVLWRTPIQGLAHSSPILWSNRVYVATAVGSGNAKLKVGLYGNIEPVGNEGPQQWRLLALDKANGKVAWNTLGHEGPPRSQRHPKASHCNVTPATDGRRIVTIFGSEGLFCFDMAGKLMWHKDLGAMDSGYYVVPSAQWGFASSPVLQDDKIVVVCDVQKDSFIAVYALFDGKQLWRTPRSDVPSWATPTLVEVGTQKQILVNGWHHIGAYDFTNGKEVWSLDGGGDIPVPTPIVAYGLAYFTSAHGQYRPMRAVRLEAQGNITPSDPGKTNAAIAWAHARMGNYMQTPIVVGENLYSCFDNGVLTCFDAKSGAVHYSERLGNGSEGFTSSPVSDGRHLFFASETGHVYVVPADGKFSITATNTLNETCMASPALSEGTLFYRTREQLVAIGQAAAK